MSLFINQELLTISLETFRDDLGDAEVKRILYWKPDYTKGFWDATVSGTKLTYDLQLGDIDQVGVWKFQAYIEIDGLRGPGEIFNHRFNKTLL